MRWAYKTTSAAAGEYVESAPPIPSMPNLNPGMIRRVAVPDPVVPDGPDWELVGTCASADRLFWTWRQPVIDRDPPLTLRSPA